MQHKPLQYVLRSHFVLNPRRLDFIASFILALIQVRTVNLIQIGTALNGLVQPTSNARRSKRFLEYDLGQERIAKFILSFIDSQKLVLAMDRTNWKFGKISINFLVIAVAFGGIAIPVAWKNLGKDGNSNQTERKTILEKLLKIIPTHRILALTADAAQARQRSRPKVRGWDQDRCWSRAKNENSLVRTGSKPYSSRKSIPSFV